MKMTRLEKAILTIAVVTLLWPFGESFYINHAYKPKTAFYQNLVLWMVIANYFFILSGLVFLILCGLLWHRFKKEKGKINAGCKMFLVFLLLLSLYLISASAIQLHETSIWLKQNQ